VSIGLIAKLPFSTCGWGKNRDGSALFAGIAKRESGWVATYQRNKPVAPALATNAADLTSDEMGNGNVFFRPSCVFSPLFAGGSIFNIYNFILFVLQHEN
jgi:hypothetical protein